MLKKLQGNKWYLDILVEEEGNQAFYVIGEMLICQILSSLIIVQCMCVLHFIFNDLICKTMFEL